MIELSKLLSDFRQERGLTYRALSDQCDKVFSANFLCNIELGKWFPSEEKLIKFCQNLEINPEDWIRSLLYSKSKR